MVRLARLRRFALPQISHCGLLPSRVHQSRRRCCEAAVESVRNAALEFARQDDWRSTSSIYRLIIEECLAHINYFYEDEEGWYGESIDTVIAELDVCLSFLADDDHDRQAILNSLMDFGKRVIHGHTPTNMPEVLANRINIDTGAFMTGRLTCLVLEGERHRFLGS